MKILTDMLLSRVSYVLLAVLGTTACGEAQNELLAPSNAIQNSSPRRHHQPTLPGDVVTEIPAPYDPALDGPLVVYIPTKAQREANQVIKSKRWPRRAPGSSIPTVAPNPDGTHNNEGKWIYSSSQTGAGIYAVNDQGLDVDIPESAVTAAGQKITIYAPTHLSAGGTCFEATTTHYRSPDDVTRHFQGFWDWCTNLGTSAPGGTNWGPTYDMGIPGDTFTPDFVRTLSTGEPSMLVQVISTTPSNPTGNCWVGIMYNFTRAQWVQMAGPICGTNQTGWGTTGWTMYEDYNLDYSCPSMAGVRASSIVTLGTNNTWYAHSISSWPNLRFQSTANCFQQGQYTFTAPSSDGGNAWHAFTPGW